MSHPTPTQGGRPPSTGGQYSNRPPSSQSSNARPPSNSEHYRNPHSGTEQVRPPPNSGGHYRNSPSDSNQARPPPTSGGHYRNPPGDSNQARPSSTGGGHYRNPPGSASDQARPPTNTGGHYRNPPNGSDQARPPPSSGGNYRNPPPSGDYPQPPSRHAKGSAPAVPPQASDRRNYGGAGQSSSHQEGSRGGSQMPSQAAKAGPPQAPARGVQSHGKSREQYNAPPGQGRYGEKGYDQQRNASTGSNVHDYGRGPQNRPAERVERPPSVDGHRDNRRSQSYDRPGQRSSSSSQNLGQMNLAFSASRNSLGPGQYDNSRKDDRQDPAKNRYSHGHNQQNSNQGQRPYQDTQNQGQYPRKAYPGQGGSSRPRPPSIALRGGLPDEEKTQSNGYQTQAQDRPRSNSYQRPPSSEGPPGYKQWTPGGQSADPRGRYSNSRAQSQLDVRYDGSGMNKAISHQDVRMRPAQSMQNVSYQPNDAISRARSTQNLNYQADDAVKRARSVQDLSNPKESSVSKPKPTQVPQASRPSPYNKDLSQSQASLQTPTTLDKHQPQPLHVPNQKPQPQSESSDNRRYQRNSAYRPDQAGKHNRHSRNLGGMNPALSTQSLNGPVELGQVNPALRRSTVSLNPSLHSTNLAGQADLGPKSLSASRLSLASVRISRNPSMQSLVASNPSLYRTVSMMSLYETGEKKPNSYLIPAIIGTILCFPIGIIGVLFSIMSQDSAKAGDMPTAIRWGTTALWTSIAFIILGSVLILTLALVLGLATS